VADAYGIKTFSIDDNSMIEDVVKQVLEFDGPALCDVHISITQPIQPRQASFKNAQGQMQSRPLEDMKPFLESEEIARILNDMSSNQ
jgi:acetolactate synthase-1/2/3 large subunit